MTILERLKDAEVEIKALRHDLEDTTNNRNEAWARYGEVCRTNVMLETRLVHAMNLLRESRTLEGFTAWQAWQDKAIALVAKYGEDGRHD